MSSTKQLLPAFWANACVGKLSVPSVQRLQTHNGFPLVQIPKLVTRNCHAVRFTCFDARASEGVGVFWLISLRVGAGTSMYVTSHNFNKYNKCVTNVKRLFLVDPILPSSRRS